MEGEREREGQSWGKGGEVSLPHSKFFNWPLHATMACHAHHGVHGVHFFSISFVVFLLVLFAFATILCGE